MNIDRLTHVLEGIENLRNEILAIAEDAKGQVDLEADLQEFISTRSRKTRPVVVQAKPQPISLSKYANVGTKVPAKVTAKAELVETPEILAPAPWESFQKYLARVMKSYGHTKALDVAKHMKMEIQTRAVQERMHEGVPNNATREVWSRYFGISENDLYEAFPKATKGASHAN